MKKKLIILFLIFISLPVYAQFEVEFNELKGELTKSDKYQEGFGRYDGFQIPLYAGEAVNFVAYSEKFTPKIVFVSPKGHVFKQSDGSGKIASIITTVPEEGEWVLYIVGDQNSFGSYSLQYALASANSIKLPADSDFCTTLNFIIAHAKAYFLLFEDPYNLQESFVKLNSANDAFIDYVDASYNAIFLETDNLKEAEKLFRQLADQVSKCLGKEWSINNSNWQKVEDYKVMSIKYSEKVNEKERFVSVVLLDFKGSKQKFVNDYSVQILINRNQ